MKITAHSDIGTNRKENQDAFFVDPSFSFAILADGMGGHSGGELASNATVTAIRHELEKGVASPETDIVTAIEQANDIVHSMATTNLAGMGTTAVVAFFSNNTAYIGNVGDSRAYILSANSFRQVTVDHNIVNTLLEIGKITENQAENHPQKNVLTRAIGTDLEVKIDIFTETLNKGDILLMCSDGLTNAVADFELEQLLKAGANPKELCDLANKRSGKDNVTVIIIEV